MNKNNVFTSVYFLSITFVVIFIYKNATNNSKFSLILESYAKVYEQVPLFYNTNYFINYFITKIILLQKTVL